MLPGINKTKLEKTNNICSKNKFSHKKNLKVSTFSRYTFIFGISGLLSVIEGGLFWLQRGPTRYGAASSEPRQIRHLLQLARSRSAIRPHRLRPGSPSKDHQGLLLRYLNRFRRRAGDVSKRYVSTNAKQGLHTDFS